MIYKFDSRVRYSELGQDKKLKLTSLLEYFQDCSTFHSEDIGVGIDYLSEHHQAWLLASWQIVIDRYADYGEKITIATWAYSFRGYYGDRNFAMYDESGEKIAYANSFWIMVDTENGKLIRPDEVQLNAYGLEPKLEMNYEPRKIKIEGEGLHLPEFQVQRHNLDTNGHVNNGQYISMARDCITDDITVKQLRAEYKIAAVLDDMIYPILYRSKDRYIVVLNDETGKAFAIVEFK